jgi:hypothetical protein
LKLLAAATPIRVARTSWTNDTHNLWLTEINQSLNPRRKEVRTMRYHEPTLTLTGNSVNLVTAGAGGPGHAGSKGAHACFDSGQTQAPNEYTTGAYEVDE